MIDLGLSKLALIGVVALVVIGPEKLPRVARMVGSLYGRAQRYITQVKSEVSREIELEELRRMQKDVESAAQDFQTSVNEEIHQVEAGINDAWQPPADEFLNLPTRSQMLYKARQFRRKKLARTSAVPQWYKNHAGVKARVLSGAARVARYRKSTPPPSFY